jgi:xylulokinase
MGLYLGIDASTQGLTALVIETREAGRGVVFAHTVSFDRDLPSYGTDHGVLPHEDPRVAVAPPMMWAEALERAMAAVAASGIDLARLRAMAGAAQQHGSVYLASGAAQRLAGLDPTRPLVPQLEGLFSRGVAPIWMDSSTSAECAEITARMGGAMRLARLTGSRAFERFTGPQIARFAATDPDGYARTERVHLVSSYLASLLIGRHAAMEPGDASGMNLMELDARRWSPEALDATAPGLGARLPDIVPSPTVVGRLAPFWTERYGFPPAAVVAWSGDNPSSLIGTGLVRQGQIGISLGTSDTVFGVMREPHVDASGIGHVFGSPTGDYMGLTCFLNGSLARERVRDAYGLDWAGVADALRHTAPGNGGAVMLPWFDPEITPHVPTPGVRRYGLDASDAGANIRAVIEAQMMAMKRHSRWMGVSIDAIHATGGASVNDAILQVMADVFGVDIRRLEVPNSAALGAALRAHHADSAASGDARAWNAIVAGFTEPTAPPIRSRPEFANVYAELTTRHEQCEADALADRVPNSVKY